MSSGRHADQFPTPPCRASSAHGRTEELHGAGETARRGHDAEDARIILGRRTAPVQPVDYLRSGIIFQRWWTKRFTRAGDAAEAARAEAVNPREQVQSQTAAPPSCCSAPVQLQQALVRSPRSVSPSLTSNSHRRRPAALKHSRDERIHSHFWLHSRKNSLASFSLLYRFLKGSRVTLWSIFCPRTEVS